MNWLSAPLWLPTDDATANPTPVSSAPASTTAAVTASHRGSPNRRISDRMTGAKHWLRNRASTNGTSTGWSIAMAKPTAISVRVNRQTVCTRRSDGRGDEVMVRLSRGQRAHPQHNRTAGPDHPADPGTGGGIQAVRRPLPIQAGV